MNIKLKSGKKITALFLALTLTVGLGSVAYAETFGDDKNGASNVEVLQVKYDGAAWNYSGSGYNWASFKYTRNGRTLLTKVAYSGKVTGSVWDDLIHWGEEYTTKFSWNRG
ncbi:hypothetical protein ACETAC_01240 [Aceticella autotrophica]|uniref:Uncharacterized protein n=1 Tax=Aceticella autotrophica TaxID=2755338 RepID=A0A975AW65_9THEO|nr:hypothetical protein [Aceticella autotrophica]QSZ27569.1 hypothetical protein ACETAC_01240 [Aceticella autotrophica]